MSNPFFERPILNSPYEYPAQHWELDKSGQPTGEIIEKRRGAEFISPIPKPRKRTQSTQQELGLEGAAATSTKQKLDPTPVINDLRFDIDQWRKLRNSSDWGVTHETARLLQHWRHHKFQSLRPFFCQVEAVETIIYLTEVAPKRASGKKYLEHLANANAEANPGLNRLALKLATGAGKTTVMAMIIAWQTINAARRDSKNFTKGFLIVTPGITIKDRLRVLLPSDPENYYTTRELIPQEFLEPIKKAKVVITNYHAFKPRERLEISKTGKSLLRGRGAELETKETDGQMLQRVMPDLMGIKNVMVLNDEAHHCYREKPGESEEQDYKGDDRKEAEGNKEAARVWISGLEIVQKKLGINRVVDLSATPFFLRGSGYPEGTLFHWTMSDFSLMDAIESGIVKLPRVPIADDIPSADVPVFRNLWEHIGKQLSKAGRGKMASADPHDLPPQLTGALEALYGHYAKTAELWKKVDIQVPPCFIIVCNNTATSKLVYDYIAGFERQHPDGSSTFVPGALELFRNYDEYGNRFARPNTLLIDSAQLESGDALDNDFRKTFSDEIEQFRREMIERGDATSAEKITDQDLLREVMNTVGRKDKLGESIRCVVSVSMLTEGWDTNTVTHVLGVRAFGTQLLCEQVIGRALRRYSYELQANDRFNPEYADILGIPFDFTAKPVVAPPQAPPKTELVRALPERAELEIRFPRVAGYRVELPSKPFDAIFNDDSSFELTPEMVGSANVLNSGIIGEQVNLTLDHTADVRPSQVSYELARHIVMFKWRDKDGNPQLNQFLSFRANRSPVDEGLSGLQGTHDAGSSQIQGSRRHGIGKDHQCDQPLGSQ